MKLIVIGSLDVPHWQPILGKSLRPVYLHHSSHDDVARQPLKLGPPMVRVKLPKGVLVVLHLFKATKLPFFGVKGMSGLITLNNVSSWSSLSVALVDKAASYPACPCLTAP
jgi:hypothetical protein